MSISPVSACSGYPTVFEDDRAIIDKILLDDPWSAMPSNDQILDYIKKTNPSLDLSDVTRIAEQLRTEIKVRLMIETRKCVF
ncbi:MAG: hypothetical protein JSR37_05865 [Verrucomicrobia bacterium]|nr:hypothetical protein [Verrucomicrobiota bacterium]MBS0637695.1 hypothetical protein [Verrucomicrobiota bacterium]